MRVSAPVEQRDTFACFGSQCTVIVSDERRPDEAARAVATSRQRLLEWHRQFSRFEPDSELNRLNADPNPRVLVSPLMRRVIAAAVAAARATGGLVDPTLLDELERAGYRRHFDGPGLPRGSGSATVRRCAAPHPAQRWRAIAVDRRTSTVTRPVGLRLDVNGIAKGVFADELAALLAGFDAFAIDCAGDLRVGGRLGVARTVEVASPFDQSALHTFELADAGVATSGISRRSWLGPGGRAAHHLLDPCSGEPVFTGVVQATAIAQSATDAEALAKAAILSGPDRASDWLPFGGALVRDDGSHRIVEPSTS